ncbi:MAG TPA: hypothetical protein VMV72_05275 [Verrucomicrobiae bacterium]|nr:hypothetical protein [Verrucomicrobiae bacterium]
MNLEPWGDAFRRCNRFSGGLFLLVLFTMIGVVVLVAVLSMVLNHH